MNCHEAAMQRHACAALSPVSAELTDQRMMYAYEAFD